MAVDPGDANEVADIEKGQAALDARRTALAAKWGEGKFVMGKPGDPYVMVVQKGQLRTIAVHYLSGGGA